MLMKAVRNLMPPGVRAIISRALGRHKIPRPRRYIPHNVSVEEFFDQLRDQQVNCVVLRWFDTLPDIEPGEDIDMLVADADLPKLAALLDSQSGSVPCDIYTTSGLAGTRYKGHAYFPAALAEATLSGRRMLARRFGIPSPIDHFDGLAYHALYQKGTASGIPTRYADLLPSQTPEHDYTRVLSDLGTTLSLEVSIDMESLDRYLANKGYRPEGEMLAALMAANPWLRRIEAGENT